MATTISRSTTTRLLSLRHLSITTRTSSPLPPIDPTVKHLVRSRRLSEVPPYLDRLLSSSSPSPPSDPLLPSVILSFGFARMPDRALSAFHLSPSPSTLSLNALLTTFSHSGLPHRVPHLLSSLSPSTPPDAQTYAILISSLSLSSSSMDPALAALAEMESKGFPPSVVAHTPIIDRLFSSGRAEEAEHLWWQMVDKGCSPDVPAYNVRARNAAERGTPGDAFKVFDEMCENGLEPDAITHNYLIACCCRNGKFLDAKKVYRRMKEEGKTNAATYRSFANFLCKSGDFGMAFEVCADGIERGTFPDAATARRLARGLMKVGWKGDAAWLVEKLRGNWPPSLAGALRMMEDEVQLHVDREA